MKKAPIQENDYLRVDAVYSYNILDTAAEGEFDALTELASKISGSPFSLITLVDNDRNWFKSKHGTQQTQDAREDSFCGHAINNPNEPFIIKNTALDERFSDNPNVVGPAKIKFYAGFPIVNKDGFALGTLCILDQKERELSEDQINILKTLSKQALMLMEHCKKESQLKHLNNELIEINTNLNEFARIVAHDMKSPVVSIQQLVKLYRDKYGKDLETKQSKILDMIERSTFDVKNLIEGTLAHTQSNRILENHKKLIDLGTIIEYAVLVSDPDKKHKIQFPKNQIIIHSNEIALKRVFMNLISNSIKHNNSEISEIEISVNQNPSETIIELVDNGPGIHPDFMDEIYNIYNRGNNENPNGVGIGLATVKKLILGLGGKIEMENLPTGGLKTVFSIPN